MVETAAAVGVQVKVDGDGVFGFLAVADVAVGEPAVADGAIEILCAADSAEELLAVPVGHCHIAADRLVAAGLFHRRSALRL